MGLKPIILGLIMSGLFAFAFITGGILIATNNNGNQSIGDDPSLISYQSSLESSLNNATNNANSSLESLGESAIVDIPGAGIFQAISGVWKTIKEIPIAIYNLTVGVLKERVFGDSFGVVFITVSAIVIILIIFGVVKLVTQGQDE